VSIDVFRRRADECRQLAGAAANAADEAFWFALAERWQDLESRLAKSRSPKLGVIAGGLATSSYHSVKEVTQGALGSAPSPERRPRSPFLVAPVEAQLPSRSPDRNEPLRVLELELLRRFGDRLSIPRRDGGEKGRLGSR